MCCTTRKKKQQSLTSQETRIYIKEELLQEATEKEETEAHFFEYGSLMFCVLFTREYFKSGQLHHLAFHAMSRGFEAYTETGYKSNFVHSGENVDKEDIEDFFKLKFDICGIDLNHPKPCVLAHVGGVTIGTQPALF